jgi:hypothetical protein
VPGTVNKIPSPFVFSIPLFETIPNEPRLTPELAPVYGTYIDDNPDNYDKLIASVDDVPFARLWIYYEDIFKLVEKVTPDDKIVAILVPPIANIIFPEVISNAS